MRTTPRLRFNLEQALASPGKVERRFDADYKPAWGWLKREYGELLFDDYLMYEIPHDDLVAAGAGGPRCYLDRKLIIVDPIWDQSSWSRTQDSYLSRLTPDSKVYDYRRCVCAMYDATHEYMHMLTRPLGDPAREPHEEFWLVTRLTGYLLDVEERTRDQASDIGLIFTYRRMAADELGLPPGTTAALYRHVFDPASRGEAAPEQMGEIDARARVWAERVIKTYDRVAALPPPHRLTDDLRERSLG